MGVSLVTGANGHLGNNLVRELIKSGYSVRAGIRNLDNANTLDGLDCEVVQCDFMDKDSLKKALEGVEILYHVAAVFKHWAKDEEEEIVRPNIEGSENIIRLAKDAGVKKIIYVSSIAALESTLRNSQNEILGNSWNVSDMANPYVRSKTLSEQKAWDVANEVNIDMISVLPSTILGGEYKSATESTNFFKGLVNNQIPFFYDVYLSFVDATDVAKGMIAAKEKGINGSRYILSNILPVNSKEILDICKEVNKDFVAPPMKSFDELIEIASIAEEVARVEGKKPQLVKSNIVRTYGIDFTFNMEKTIKDLGYNPKSAKDVLRETLEELLVK